MQRLLKNYNKRLPAQDDRGKDGENGKARMRRHGDNARGAKDADETTAKPATAVARKEVPSKYLTT